MKESEILANGLKRALERGESLEKAKQTFINAGYDREAIEKASKLLSEEKIQTIKPKLRGAQKESQQYYRPQIKKSGKSNIPPLPTEQKQKKSKKLILIISLLILIVVIGVLIFFFRESLLDVFGF